MSAALSTQWHDVGGVEDIPPLGARVVELPGRRIALFRTRNDRFFALEDRCPHRGGPLADGIVSGDSVVCPLHQWKVCLSSGAVMRPQEQLACVRSFPVKVIDGVVLVEIEAEKAKAA